MDLLIFGARGDLAARKLFPALYHLLNCSLLPEGLRIHALAREELDLDSFLGDIKAPTPHASATSASISPGKRNTQSWRHS